MQSKTLRSVVQGRNDESLNRIRQHPFIVQAHARKLTKSQSERWILCAGRESHSFPKILENMVARCTNERVTEILRENLNDEYGNGNTEHAHFKHYLHLLDNLGIARVTFDNYREQAGIKLALSLAYNISTQPSEGVAIGYMLVNEGMTPITYEAARSTLTHYYPKLRTTFFDLHIEVDEHHVEELYKAVEAMPESSMEDLLFGISIGERGMAVLLDEALGMFDYYECDSHAKACNGGCRQPSPEPVMA
jgi:pyrroloquinoline quinone (PQQ) biosynthesis protein C